MTDSKYGFTDDESKIACCKTCLLADIMKACATCPFNIGLRVVSAPAEVWKRAMIVKSELFAQNKGARGAKMQISGIYHGLKFAGTVTDQDDLFLYVSVPNPHRNLPACTTVYGEKNILSVEKSDKYTTYTLTA